LPFCSAGAPYSGNGVLVKKKNVLRRSKNDICQDIRNSLEK